MLYSWIINQHSTHTSHQTQRTPQKTVNGTRYKRRLSRIKEELSNVLQNEQIQFVSFVLRSRGPKRLKSALLRLSRGDVEPEDQDFVVPLSGRTVGQGFAWKRGKAEEARIVHRVAKADAEAWAKTLVSMEVLPSRSRVEIEQIVGVKELFSENEMKTLERQRTKKQLAVIERLTAQEKRYIIVPSSQADHSDNSSGDDYLISIASDSDRDSDSQAVSDAIRDRQRSKNARLYNVYIVQHEKQMERFRELEDALKREKEDREQEKKDWEQERNDWEQERNELVQLVAQLRTNRLME